MREARILDLVMGGCNGLLCHSRHVIHESEILLSIMLRQTMYLFRNATTYTLENPQLIP